MTENASGTSQVASDTPEVASGTPEVSATQKEAERLRELHDNANKTAEEILEGQ